MGNEEEGEKAGRRAPRCPCQVDSVCAEIKVDEKSKEQFGFRTLGSFFPVMGCTFMPACYKHS